MPRRASVQVTSLMLPMYRFHEDPFPPLQRAGPRGVYPYPMQDDLTDELAERDLQAVVLDNGLLRATVLPELGGHVLSLRDLAHDREVLYHNVPLKFGLIALRGAWYAGGIEFNFPQVGHSVTTSDRVSWHVREEEDGSATLFLGSVEHLTRMAWTVALSLRPDDWRLGVRVSLFNRTPFAHRIYFWTNTAVPARDDFRFLLPATQVYSWWYGADGAAPFPISKGRDISRYATFQRAADMFAKDLRADWFGCYYEDLDCGVLHHAPRFDVQGRKLFTWGNADDGMVWAELLNDSGEPYVEIQSGRFVHQGVHRLMPPHSVETWQESWGPVWGLGGVVHATDTLAMNATREGESLTLSLLALVPVRRATLTVRQGDMLLGETELAFAAGEGKSLQASLHGLAPVTVEVRGENAALKVSLLVDGETVRAALDAAPPHTAVPDRPADAAPTTPHAWLLKARDLEERSDLDAAADAYRKALDLDPQCAAAMAGLAQWHLKRSETARAREWAHKALAVDLQNEDALWWLSVANFLEPGKGEDATAYLFALQRSPRYAASAHVLLGELALRRGEPLEALDLFSRALARNASDSRAWALAALAARMAGNLDAARLLLARCENESPLEPLLWSERCLLTGDRDAATAPALGDDVQACLEAACDYERVGAWEAAEAWLALRRESVESGAKSEGPGASEGEKAEAAAAARSTLHASRSTFRQQPMLLYHSAFALWQRGKATEAIALAREASALSPLFAFPHRHEDGLALQTALRLSPDDALARLLLGTWLASLGRWDEALDHWKRSTELAAEGELAVVAWRNVGLARWLRQRSADEALSAYGRALDAMPFVPRSSPLVAALWRLWLERDSVLSAQGRHAERLAAFDSAPDAVKAHSQALARWTDACLRAGKPERAAEMLSRCSFKPWEGEMRARQLWKEAHMQLGHQAKAAGKLDEARRHFEAAAEYPRHLNVGRPAWTDDADAFFWAGWCAAQCGEREAARRLLTLAATEQQLPNAPSAEFRARAADLLKTIG